MKLYIKNMVCNRSKMVVKAQLESRGLRLLSVNLGEVEIEGNLSKDQLSQLDTSLKSLGFELIDNKKSKTIEKIKNAIVTLVHHSDHNLKTNLSEFIGNCRPVGLQQRCLFIQPIQKSNRIYTQLF